MNPRILWGISLGLLLILLLEGVNLVRELRDNNPLGVNTSHTFSFDNLQKNPDGSPIMDGPLYKFKTYQDGLNAAAEVLHDMYFPNGWNTPNLIAYHWTGGTTYTGADLVSRMGANYEPDQTLDFSTDGALLMEAIAYNENGMEALTIPSNEYVSAVQYGEEPSINVG